MENPEFSHESIVLKRLADFGSSERQCRICAVSSLRFWHIALMVIIIMLREREF